jgi:hypothetical protein
MTEPGVPYELVYVHTDIPVGMTIHEWRTRRAAERQELRLAARAQRRQRRRRAVRGTHRNARGGAANLAP